MPKKRVLVEEKNSGGFDVSEVFKSWLFHRLIDSIVAQGDDAGDAGDTRDNLAYLGGREGAFLEVMCAVSEQSKEHLKHEVLRLMDYQDGRY